MPTIMEQPYPIEFVNKGDTILLRLEEYDSVRTISMAATSNVDSLRCSAGRLLEHRGAVHADGRRHAPELHDDRHRPGDVHCATRTEEVVGVAAGRDRQAV
jgi:hypothetical protein